MYAIIKASGKQFTVKEGDLLTLERLALEPGQQASFDVLALGEGEAITLGAPLVAGASVTGDVIEHVKGDKIIIFKKKRRHNYRRKNGHRQPLTTVRIRSIQAA
jgi:large subunit ribosomal protein L21